MEGLSLSKKSVVVAATDVEITQPESSELEKDGTLQLVATVTPSNSTDTVTWASSNTDAATVSSSGLVTAKEVAEDTTVTITATAGTHSDTVTLTIKAPAAAAGGGGQE